MRTRLRTMLRMVGFGDNAGSGFPFILATWKEEGWGKPELIEDTTLNQVTLYLKMIPENEKQSAKKQQKLYRKKIGEWQEHYMEKLVKEYADYLCSDLPASTKFWEIEKRIKRDRKTPGVCIELRKSDMFWDIAGLINDIEDVFRIIVPLNDRD